MSKKSIQYLLFFILVFQVVFFSSCRKETFYQGADQVLIFSQDTLTFDTVFTQLSTVTRYFKVENPLNNSIKLDKVVLKNLDGLSTFRINVNGEPGTLIENVEIPGKDYIYIFVEATVDPNGSNNPFIILDEIEYHYNDVVQKNHLSAWGQDAYFHFGEIYENESITWQNDKPHVVIRNSNFPGVGIDSFSTLTILPGCKVYVDQGAGIFADGELYVGQAGNQDSVSFQSIRVETLQNGISFEDNPGLWQGIGMFSGSRLELYNVSINQAIWGIQGRHYTEDIYDMVDDMARPVLILDKVRIRNSAQNAIIALNSDLTVTNSLFYKSGSNLIAVALGGIASFDNCTLYNNGVAGSDDSETLVLSNFAQTSTGTGINALEFATFTNCIVDGNASEQIVLSNDPQADFIYTFNNCLLKTELDTSIVATNTLFNEDPKFVSSSNDDYHLSDDSPCISAGVDNGITEDIDFNSRNTFDIGAFAY